MGTLPTFCGSFLAGWCAIQQFQSGFATKIGFQNIDIGHKELVILSTRQGT